VNEVDRKYNERKLFYENLLLKQKLRKHGINNDVYGDTLSSYNDTSFRGNAADSNTNEINKIIDDKLKPIEAKQNNFMQMMHSILYNNGNSGNAQCYNYNEQLQQQTPFVVQNACGNEIYGHKSVDVGSIVKEKVLESVLRERISKENAMRENELRKMLQREKQLREKEESIRKDKDKRILELENKEKLLEMQQNEMKKKLEGYEANNNKNEASRCVYSNMIVQPENEKKNKNERTNDSVNSATNEHEHEATPKKKPKLKHIINTKRHKPLIASNYNNNDDDDTDEWNNIDFSKYLNQKPKHTKRKRNNNNNNNNIKKIRLEKSEYPKMWLGRRVDNSILDNN
jgi:hypothetical protein